MRALIVIDYTNDFVADEGRLTCGERGQSIEEKITEIVGEFIQNDDYVVFAVDGHQSGDKYHPEYPLFPEHNVLGTEGRDLYGKLGVLYEKEKDLHLNNIYWMDKTRYSAFAGTDLELKLREREITELHLVGVCTDICVLHTAVEAFNKGFSLNIHANAVESFDPEGHSWALRHFKQTLGAKVYE